MAVDAVGREVGRLTVRADDEGLWRLCGWADQFDADRMWAVEDGRGVAGRLVRGLLAAGARVVWVPPRLMAQCRASGRARGKSDPIDALAIARAALREPDLPAAQLDETALALRLLTDRREQLVTDRTRAINQLRWQLHDLAPELDAKARRLASQRRLTTLRTTLRTLPGSTRRDLAIELTDDITRLCEQIRRLERDLARLVEPVAPALLGIVGVNVITAAKIIGEVGGIHRFRSPAAFASHTGTAPIPVWSANKPSYRLNRGGNRQLNTCLHRIAITQLTWHQPTRDYRDRWAARHPHATTKAALRALKRHLSDVIYRALTTDAHQQEQPQQAA